jgi:hypothetical protein
MLVAPTPASREEIPEAQEIDAEVDAEVRPEMSQLVGDFLEWPDKHVPIERMGKRHGRGRGGRGRRPDWVCEVKCLRECGC